MLWDKGIGEFVDAARIVRLAYPAARFRLLGFLDVDNRTAVPRASVEQWVADGVVEYRAPVADVRPEIADADVLVLPSYREGTARALLEAAALARPIVTTDVPGCREVVDEGVSGYLCKVKDAESLSEAMIRMVRLTPEERTAMGLAGRAKVERSYDERLVISAYIERLSALSARTG
jgi:glycosyltransferase involved in cell wall biosynthesis